MVYISWPFVHFSGIKKSNPVLSVSQLSVETTNIYVDYELDIELNRKVELRNELKYTEGFSKKKCWACQCIGGSRNSLEFHELLGVSGYVLRETLSSFCGKRCLKYRIENLRS